MAKPHLKLVRDGRGKRLKQPDRDAVGDAVIAISGITFLLLLYAFGCLLAG